MLHSHSLHVVLIEKWAEKRNWGRVGPRSFRAYVAPVLGWVVAQHNEALLLAQTEREARRWDNAKWSRDVYAAAHGGYNSSGFAIPGAVAAAARGER